MSRSINRLKYKKKLLYLEAEDLKRTIKQLKASIEWYKSELVGMNELGTLEHIIEECLQAQREACARKYKAQHQDTVSTRSVYEDILNARLRNETGYILGYLSIDEDAYTSEI